MKKKTKQVSDQQKVQETHSDLLAALTSNADEWQLTGQTLVQFFSGIKLTYFRVLVQICRHLV